MKLRKTPCKNTNFIFLIFYLRSKAYTERVGRPSPPHLFLKHPASDGPIYIGCICATPITKINFSGTKLCSKDDIACMKIVNIPWRSYIDTSCNKLGLSNRVRRYVHACMAFSTFLDTWDRGYIEASWLMCLLQWPLYCHVLSAQLFARHRKLEVKYNKQYRL